MDRVKKLLPILLILLIHTPTSVFAQGVNGAFHGTVNDTTGAIVPDAKVEVRNLSNGQMRTVSSDQKGFYTVTDLPPGHYAVLISKTGFTTVSRPDIPLQESQDLQLDSTLNIGLTTSVVEVTTEPSMLATASATLDHTVGSKEAVDLPLNGRQFTQLILLTPGSSPREGGQQAGFTIAVGGSGISPNVNGQRGGQNTFTLDGILDNHPYIQVWTISPPPDAIQEFKTQNHISDAQFSFSSGANINVLTKSGTNEFHGDVWEFLRNDALNAANYIDNYSGNPKPSYLQNQYGFTLGGPIWIPHIYDGRKKNTHFFGYWEGFQSDQGLRQLTNVPTTAELGGNFSDLLTGTQAVNSAGQLQFDALGRPIMKGAIYNPYSTRTVNGQLVRDPYPGNIIPNLNKAAVTYLNTLYNPANFGLGGNSFPNRSSVGHLTITSNQFGVGFDHAFRNNDSVFGKFYYSQPDQTSPTSVNFGATQSKNHARVFTSSYTHLFSPTFLATFRYGYSWLLYGLFAQPGGTALAEAINSTGFQPETNGSQLVPGISIGPRGFTSSNQTTTPMGPMHSHQANADLMKIKGSNTISTGVLFLRLHAFDESLGGSVSFDQFPSSALTTGNVNVSSTGDGLASMLLDLPSGYQGFFGNTAADLTTFWLGAYVQDKWQATNKLNIQFGMRWDFEAPPHYKNNEFAMWNSHCPMGTYNTPATLRAIQEQCLLIPTVYVPAPTPSNPNPLTWPVPNIRSSIWAPQYNGFQPRLGIAYSATQKTVIRAAFNIFDDHNNYDKEVQDSRSTWPFGGQTIPTSLNRGTPAVFFDALPSAQSFLEGATPVFGRAGNPDAKIPYVMQYNLGVEQQLSQNVSLEVNYVGSQSRHLWGTYGYNAPLPQNMGPNAIPNGEPFPFIKGTIHADDNLWPASYNGGQIQIKRRYSQGLTLLSSYTYSKCMDEIGGEFDPIPQNTYDLGAEYSVCEANFPHLFSFSGAYQLPFGRGRAFGSGVGRGMDALIGGWNISDITSVHSGTPFTASVSSDNANTGTPQRANIVPGCSLVPQGFVQNIKHWYNPACFAVAPPYTFGNSRRNGYRGPDYVDSDIAIFKDIKLGEARVLQLRVETFNTFNHTALSPPGATATGAYASLGGSVVNAVDGPNFMQILSAAPARQIQVAGRFSF